MSNTIQDPTTVAKGHLENLFKDFELGLNGRSQSSAHAYRKAAIAKLQELSFPTRRDEDWKYTSVAKVIQPPYQVGQSFEVSEDSIQSFRIEGLDAYQIIMANGQLQTDLTSLNLPDGIYVDTIENAIQHDEKKSLFEHDEQFSEDQIDNAFVALNGAFASNGLFIHIGKNVVLDKPIQIVYFNQSVPNGKPMLITPKVTLVAEENSEANVVEQFCGLEHEAEYFTNSVNRFLVHQNARLSHYKIQLEGQTAYQIVNTEVIQHRDSTYSSYAIDLGSKIVRNNISSTHKNTGISTNLFGLYLPTEQQHMDTQTFIDHATPHCVSNELYKGIIKDRARGVFNGKVLVRQDAQKINAFQQNSTLVLSDKAVMDSKPQLEIFADDVRCSHGATIGQLDESAVYYLKTRGLSAEKAKALLQLAFLGEVIEKIDHESIKSYVADLVQAKLGA